KTLNQTNQMSGVSMSANQATQTEQSQGPAVTAPEVDEKARIQGILTSDEAKGRESQANHLAFSTSMSAEDAIAVLASAPAAAESVQAHGTALDAAMSAEQNPVIKGDVSESAEVSEVDQIMSAFKIASGE
ncbi:hypothetical protein, partial [Methylophaga sp.]|uniref:hypothetical protein n=1 Tax=Methylophaga sp. TaxID=2024840 RepID=UPI003A8E7275